MYNPLISVITVVRNDDKHIQNCIDSVYNQQYKNVEHVIIDGASIDNTVEILLKNEDKLSYWVSEPDAGIYDAMNKAVKHCKGEYIFFLGSDDVLLDGFSDMALNLKHQNTLYYGRVIYKGKVHYGQYDKYALAYNNICHHAIFYPKIVFEKYQYNTDYKIYADYILNLTCWKDSTIPFRYYDIVISEFNHTGISGYTIDELFDTNKFAIIKEFLGLEVYFYCKWRVFREKMIAKYYRRKGKILKLFK